MENESARLRQRIAELEAELSRRMRGKRGLRQEPPPGGVELPIDPEKALQESEEKFRLAFHTSPDSINLNRLSDGLYLDVNEGFTQLMGYTREEVVGKTSLELNIWVDPTERDRLVRDLAAKGVVSNFEARFRGKNGRVATALMSARVLTMNREKVILSITRDITRRKRAEDDLRESEAIFSLFMEHCPVYVFFKDETARPIRLSRNYEQMLGRPIKDLLGKGMEELFPAELAKGMIEDDLGVIRDGVPIRVVEEFGGRYFETLKFPIIRPNNSRMLAGFTIDITERRQAEEALRQSERSAQRLAEEKAAMAEIGRIIGASLVIEDVYERFAAAVKKIIAFDRIAVNLVDWEKKTICVQYVLGPSIEGRMAGDEFPLAGTATAMAVESGRGLVIPTLPDEAIEARLPGQIPLRRAGLKSLLLAPLVSKGQALGALVMMSAEPDKYAEQDIPVAENVAAQISGAIANAKLVLERRQAEKELRESEERYRKIVEASTDAILIRADGVIIYANPAALKLLRADRSEDLVGKPYLDFVHPEDRAESIERIRKGEEEKWIAPPREHRMVALDGQVVPVESTGVPIQYQGRTQIFGAIRDISERKRLEEDRRKIEAQLRQAQKMESVGRLAGGVAHDFNNMLSVILGYTDLALTRLDAQDPIYQDLREVKSAAKRSADLTRQLLAFARKQTIVPKVLDLNDTVANTLKMLGRLIGEDIDLVWIPGKNLWPVKVDPAQVDQVLANLAVNARDAIAGHGKITIETGNAEFDQSYCSVHEGSAPGRYVMLAVSDDGCGMDKKTQEQLFEPFFTTKEVGKGTGLGLATVYGIVRQNDGFINVYSEPGQGTTFKIYLPCQEPVATAAGPPPAAMVPTGTETVLLVEDEEALLRFARILLEKLGYTVLAAGSPIQAIQLAREYAGGIHLLMTDVVMPGLGGHDLWKQLDALRPGIKCLFMSGYTPDVMVRRAILEQGVHYLQKPFSSQALAVKLREVLSGG